jgi:hypothetical protein
MARANVLAATLLRLVFVAFRFHFCVGVVGFFVIELSIAIPLEVLRILIFISGFEVKNRGSYSVFFQEKEQR